MELKIYHLKWEKYSWDKINSNLKDFMEKRHKGIYQIYGTHHIYGKDSLLYIGQTKDQTFGQRLNSDQHWDFNVNHFTEISYICIGMLIERDHVTNRNYKKVIAEIEYILINSHCPAFNSTNLKGIKRYKDNEHFIILNWDNYDQLLPEVSTLKFSDKYWDNELYKEKVIFG